MSKPKVVVLDGFILNPGDISWAEIESISDLKVYDRVDYDNVKDVAYDAWGILNSKVKFDKKQRLGKLSKPYVFSNTEETSF